MTIAQPSSDTAMAKGQKGVKPQIRTLGIDDSRFRFKEGKAYLVAVQMRETLPRVAAG